MLVELPVLVAVTAKPAATVIVPLIREAHGYAIVEKVPHLFDEAIAQLASPLARQECFYYRTALQKFRSIRQSLSAL